MDSFESQGAWLSPKAYAQASGISLATVRRYLKLGLLPKLQPGGKRGRVCIPRSSLEVRPACEAQADTSLPRPIKSPKAPGRLAGRVPNWLLTDKS
jgi:hypothetical protein